MVGELVGPDSGSEMLGLDHIITIIILIIIAVGVGRIMFIGDLTPIDTRQE